VLALVLAARGGAAGGQPEPAPAPEPGPGLLYTNYRMPDVPWSIHVVRVPRTNAAYEIHAVHAGGAALGLEPLSRQVGRIDPRLGRPVAALNGDFYLRDKAYAGAPRGPQIVNGELVSGPRGGAALWVDVLREPHLAALSSRCEVTWPGGGTTPFLLNTEPVSNSIVLYTPAVGTNTRTAAGTEIILERDGPAAWLPARLGRTCPARVRSTTTGGGSAVPPDGMVLSLPPAEAARAAGIKAGDHLRLSFAADPPVHGALTALGGGPILVSGGRARKITASAADAYASSSMLERHPRSAVGWSRDAFFLVEVDGRQRDLSDGMTLEELAGFLVKLGCEEALNLDGGGSATLWYEGSVRNSPCDGYERPVANGLVVVRKAPAPARRTTPRG